MSSNPFDLTGKVAVVTGATGVLCSVLCRGLVEAGAKVVAIARDEDKLAALVASLQQAGGEALGVSADVLDRTALQARC
jgi:NADP-dependent 3-hydroxy acid dehydrogenase YdfG